MRGLGKYIDSERESPIVEIELSEWNMSFPEFESTKYIDIKEMKVVCISLFRKIQKFESEAREVLRWQIMVKFIFYRFSNQIAEMTDCRHDGRG